MKNVEMKRRLEEAENKLEKDMKSIDNHIFFGTSNDLKDVEGMEQIIIDYYGQSFLDEFKGTAKYKTGMFLFVTQALAMRQANCVAIHRFNVNPEEEDVYVYHRNNTKKTLKWLKNYLNLTNKYKEGKELPTVYEMIIDYLLYIQEDYKHFYRLV